jgi:two-component system LytT family response regulator
MKIRCLIIDDKPLAIDILADFAGKIPFLELIATTTNPIEGLSVIREQEIDLVFLDVQMPELTGLQFLKIAGKQCLVVLTTAYAEYALDGFENDVVDYLLKPISFERFYKAAEKAYRFLRQELNNNVSGQIDEKTAQQLPPVEFLFVKTEHRIQKVNIRDILYVEALQNYISFNTLTGRILSLQPLKKIEPLLPQNEFVRVHKSYIVSLRHLASVERGRVFIGETIIPVGDIYRENFYKRVDQG